MGGTMTAISEPIFQGVGGYEAIIDGNPFIGFLVVDGEGDADMTRRAAHVRQMIEQERGKDTSYSWRFDPQKATKIGRNPSGLVPMEFNVILKKIDVEQKTKGGLLLPDEHRDRMQWREQRAKVVSVSPSAFTFEANAPRVEPGEEVVIAKNAGGEVTALDGETYHIVKDTDIIAKVVK